MQTSISQNITFPALSDEHAFLEDLLLFVKPAYNWPQTRWIYGTNLRLYVRKGPRYINGVKYDTVTVATVEVHTPRKGIYTDLLRLLESYGEALYVENVFNRDQDHIYLNRGFTSHPSEMPSFCQSFYKILDQNTR